MNKHNEAYLDELIHDAAYEAVRQSPLFHKCSNSVVDTKADVLAARVRSTINEWIDSESVSVFPIGSQFLSLSEAESERNAEAA